MKNLFTLITLLFISSLAFSQISLTSTVTNVSCFGGSNGSATVSATGGTGGYTYTWTPTNTNSPTITGLSTGQYTVTVMDISLSTSSLVVIIGEPSILSSITNANNVKCFGTATGTISATATGGIPPYSYTWPAIGTTLATVPNVATGIYTVIVTDANGCVTGNSVTVNQPSQLIATTTVTNANCGQANGSSCINATGGAPAYFYYWDNSSNATCNTNISAGVHSYTVVDANGCLFAGNTIITNVGGPTVSISSQTNTTCFGLCNGAATASAIGGTTPYIYSWSQGQVTPTASNLCAGVYTVSVTDANGCIGSNSVIITQPNQMVANSVPTNVTCNGACNGSYVAAAMGGTPPYSYINNLGNIGANVSNLCPGSYTISVTDANNCLFQMPITITQPQQLVASISSTNANCSQANGAVCASVSGGQAPLNFQWSNGSTIMCANGLFAGVYTFTVIDINGCMAVQSGLVNNIGGPVVSVVSQTNVTCFGGNNGAVTTTITGGTTPYNFSWTGATSSSTSAATNLPAGMYGLTVVDAGGCIGTASVMINQPSPININTNSTNALCGQNNGSISATVTGGTPIYMFTWIPNVGFSNTVQNLSAGSYTLQITDVNGCISATSASISSIGNGALSNVTASLIPTQETCLNLNDGSMDLTLTGSNTGPFTYQWNNGATTEDIFNLNANYYSVIVFDANLNCLSIGDTVKFNGSTCGSITGNVFIDNNSDCIKNSGDGALSNTQIIANPGNRIGYTNYNGDYYFYNLPFGTYTLTANTNTVNMIATCATTINAILNSGNQNSNNNNFTREYIPITQPDLYVSAYSNGIVPGFVCRVNYALHNYNTFNANGLFKVTLPSTFIPNITNVFPSVYTSSGDTIIWNFTNINYMGYNYNFHIDFTTPLSTPLGSIFTSCMWAQPTITDLNYANNTYCYQRAATGSFDPNDKSVSPVGVGATGDIAASVTDLTYLIRFQNTGNGPAVNIVVKDTLSPNVDVNTFEMLGSSHNYNIEILPGNILKWKFNNIMLPDSNSNEPGSHGYIQYRIKRTNNNTPGTQIKNTAYIYFDFNEPVVTNTAINTIETITGTASQLSNNDGWNVYPNPSTGALYIVNSSASKETSQIQVFNSMGQTVLEESITSNYKNIDLSKLNNGVYFVKITSDKNTTVNRVVLRK